MAANEGCKPDALPDVMPLCHTCYGDAPEKMAIELPGGYTVHVWPLLKNNFVSADNVSECGCPWCPNRPTKEEGQECPGCESLRECLPSDPDICDCGDPEDKKTHEEILSDINKMERSVQELEVARGVTVQLNQQVKANKEIDPAQPCGSHRILLAAMSTLSVNVDVDDNQMATPPGRPLSMIHDPKAFHCHTCKIASYGPANCSCTEYACSCLNCVAHHVKHAEEDYEDAVKRARLGITKLQAMRRAAPAETSNISSAQLNNGGCHMPGVRKAKHLKNYTRAKKDEYNRDK